MDYQERLRAHVERLSVVECCDLHNHYAALLCRKVALRAADWALWSWVQWRIATWES